MKRPLHSRGQLRAAGISVLVLLGCCQGFSVPNKNPSTNPGKSTTTTITTTTTTIAAQATRGASPENPRFPLRLEDWDHNHVEDWLFFIGFDRYTPGFASDFGGIGVDGDRLVYLGTEDQLDHIEYQLELIGVQSPRDQLVLGAAIIELVASSSEELAPDVLKSLAAAIPLDNRKQEDNGDDSESSSSSSSSSSYDDVIANANANANASDVCDKAETDRNSIPESMDYEI